MKSPFHRMATSHTKAILSTLLTTTVWLYFTITPTLASSAAGRETIIGLVGPDYIILGTDSSSAGDGGIALTVPTKVDKIIPLLQPAPHSQLKKKQEEEEEEEEKEEKDGYATIAVAAGGDGGDVDRLLGLLQAHCVVREYEEGYGADVECVFDGQHHSSKNSDTVGMSHAPPLWGVSRASATGGGLDAEAVAHLAQGEIHASLRSARPLRACLMVAGMVPTIASINKNLLAASKSSSQGTKSDEEETYYQSHPSRRVQMQVKDATTSFQEQNEPIQNGIAEGSLHSQEQPGKPGTTRTAVNSLQPKLFWLDEYGSMQSTTYAAHGYGSNFCLSILDQRYRPNLTRHEAAQLVHDCFQQLRTRYVVNMGPDGPCLKCVDGLGCWEIKVGEESGFGSGGGGDKEGVAGVDQ